MDQFFSQNENITLMVCCSKHTELHKHDFLEMVYVIKGKAHHVLNGTETIIQAGDYFIIDYEGYHQYHSVEDKEFVIINTLFKPEIIDKVLIHCHSFKDLINHYLIRFHYTMLEKSPTDFIFHDDDGSVLALIKKLQHEFEKKNSGYLELMRCYLLEIIIGTMRRISKNTPCVSYHDCSRYILNYVDQNYMKPLTLTEISRELNFSLPYICRRFKNEVGMSFVEYLQKKRIEQSCRLILNTDKKIADIAELVGYTDTKFFNQIFKKHLKMTPREFKSINNQS
jgi:AraC-like DNA-binding protein